jgi:hypothetical protein
MGDVKFLSMEKLVELKERIKQVVETNEFKKIQDFSSFGKQIYKRTNAQKQIPDITIEVKLITTLGALSDK